MCQICRKYRCPDGCPNNYTPTRKGKRATFGKIRYAETLVTTERIAEYMRRYPEKIRAKIKQKSEI